MTNNNNNDGEEDGEGGFETTKKKGDARDWSVSLRHSVQLVYRGFRSSCASPRVHETTDNCCIIRIGLFYTSWSLLCGHFSRQLLAP